MAAFVLYSKVAHFRTRVTALVDPIGHIDDEGYQLSQSIFSIANGGLFGTGLTRGLPRAIPLVEMDFMFSAVCEELGLIVAFALIAASLALFCHLMNLCMSASVGDNSSRLSIGAIACLVIFQNFLTIGGALRFIPSTGVVLPFVSYGGSSFMGCSMLFAAVFAIIRYGRRGIYVAKR
jgi:cell division protein FtsW (lipid II flippase)